MGWNGSNLQSTDSGRAGRPSRATSVGRNNGSGLSRGLLAGLLVVAIGGAIGGAAVYFSTRPPAPTAGSEPDEPAPAPEVKSVATPKAESPAKTVSEPKKPVKEELPPQRVGEIRNGYRLLPSGRLHRVRGVIQSGVRRSSVVDKTFDAGSDRMIAHLLVAEPGGTMVGDSESIMRGFNEAFEKSAETPIIIEDDDTEEIRQLKQAVIDARKEIMDQVAKGRTPEDVMIEAREQLRELTLYREELEKEVISHTEDEMTQEDYDELIGAANLMLEERGIGKIQMPKFVGEAIEINYRRKTAELEKKARELERKLNESEEENQ